MLAFESSGSGQPIVFLHAFPLSRSMWDIHRDAFSAHHRFITIDLPGFGDSPLTSDISTMSDMSTQVLTVLDHIGVREKFVLAGLSMGGYVAFQILHQAPERVSAAAFFSTRSGADSVETKEKRRLNIELVQKEGSRAFAARALPGMLGATTLSAGSPVVDLTSRFMSAASTEAICAALRGMVVRPDRTDVIDKLGIPTLFVAGAEDKLISPSEMKLLSQRSSLAEFHEIAGAGHLLNLEKPALFEGIFLDFLRKSL